MKTTEKSGFEGLRHPAVSTNAVPAGNIRGFTLVELLIVAAILGVLVTMAVPSYQHYVKAAKIARCRTEIITIDKEINAYFIDKGTLPTSASLAELGQGPLIDPWGRAYRFYNIAVGGGSPYLDTATNPLNTDYDLYSLGEDGQTDKELLLSDVHSQDDIIRAYEGALVQSGVLF
jgi:general secretion pathway protein G